MACSRKLGAIVFYDAGERAAIRRLKRYAAPREGVDSAFSSGSVRP